MNKFVAATLIGATSAAPGPAVASAWPKFATQTAIAAGDMDSKYVKADWSQQSASLTGTVGQTRAVRGDQFALYSQMVTKVQTTNPTTSGAVTGVASADAAKRAFWVFASANLGTYITKLTNATTASTSDDIYWGVCKTVDDSEACNSFINYADAKQTMIANRIIFKISATAGSDYKDAAVTGTGQYLQFNTDILVAATYHSEDDTGSTTDGSKWCTAFDTKVTNNGAAVNLKAQYGLTGRTKCTWFLTAEDQSVGISFKVTQADDVALDMQWLEFGSTDALETNSQLPAADAADWHLGAYAAGSNGAVWLNPLSTTMSTTSPWNANGINRWADYKDPTLYPGGSIGSVLYFPGLPGDQKDSQELTMDVFNIQQMYGMTNAVNNAYNNAVAAYNPLREAYDSAVQAEQDRLNDALKAVFEPQVTIPERPCAPYQPAAYSGFYLDLALANAATGNTKPTTQSAAEKLGWLKRAVTGVENTSSLKASIASGFVYLQADTSITTPALGAKVGHVFGRLGQNDQTIPEGDKPFVWKALTSPQKAAMMVSIFPTTDASTGLASGKTLTIETKGMAWTALTDYNKPNQPAAAQDPTSTGAAMLSLGVASAVVLSTLA